jgi:YidC/Oxa1 family membrane protein insertase
MFKPFETFIGTIFLWLVKTVNNYGISLILLSVIVSTILLPFYHFAEKLQQKERLIQQRMKPKIDEFKSVYKGYELYLYINNVYRLNNYHPAYALRGLLSLMIQIPFFIGAYAFLANYEGLVEVSFLFLSDLAAPDKIISLGFIKINFLPFLMTGINLISGYVYAKGMTWSENITIIVVSLIFLIVLYNASSGLLVYWTCNTTFNLGKNLLYKYWGKIRFFHRKEMQ